MAAQRKPRGRAGGPAASTARAAWDRPGPALGEFALIERLRAIVPGRGEGVVAGIGDDTAVLRSGQTLLATCDVQVEGVHFTRDLCTPADVGWRALAVNLSDVAAMGGTPRYALVSLLIPPSTGSAALEDLYRGMADLARQYGVALVGGNVSRTAGPLAVDVTLLGEAEHPVLRDGARPGDGIWITGQTGKAAAGRFLLEHANGAAPTESLAAAYRRPAPRVAAGQALGRLAKEGIVTAMIDTSDGTAGDLLHLAEASHVGVRLNGTRLPVPDGLAEAARAAGVALEAWTLEGGEDYELLFTATAAFEARAAEAADGGGVAVTRVGDVRPEPEGRWIVTAAGRTPLRATAWDHLACR